MALKRRRIYLAGASFCFLFLCFLLFQSALFFGARDARAQGYEHWQGQAEPAGIADGYEKGRRPRPVPDDWEFTILSAGDIMMHSPQTKAGLDSAGGSYDFSFMFEKVAPILREGDLVVGNLETPLAGKDNGGFTGYPLFNAPEILAQNLKDAGFTLLSTANNHCIDRRFQGLSTTLDHLDAAGLMHTGTFRSAEERNRILHIGIKGVNIAVLAATYGTNGLTLPGEYGFAVNYIQEEKLLDDIRRARREGAGYVIVMLHWGMEYQTKPNAEQTSLAVNLIMGGADLILGNHPHVLQRGEAVRPAELYARTENQSPLNHGYGDEATGSERVGFIMYSQGNFVSNQEGMDRLSSILLKLTIGVDGSTKKPYFKEAGYIPVYTQKRDRQGAFRHTVWPLELALTDLETGGKSFNAEDRAIIPKAWDYVINSQPAINLISLKNTSGWDELIDFCN